MKYLLLDAGAPSPQPQLVNSRSTHSEMKSNNYMVRMRVITIRIRLALRTEQQTFLCRSAEGCNRKFNIDTTAGVLQAS